jgi:hypothetical protein
MYQYELTQVELGEIADMVAYHHYARVRVLGASLGVTIDERETSLFLGGGIDPE